MDPIVRGRLRRRLAVGMVLCSTLLGGMSAAEEARAFEVAIQDGELVSPRNYDRNRAFRQMKAIGVKSIRINAVWSDYVLYGVRAYDAAVNAARRAGFKVQFTVIGTPFYVDTRVSTCVSQPDPTGCRRARPRFRQLNFNRPSPVRYATFIRALAKHYKGRVKTWSIWNEPNLRRYLQPIRSAHVIYRNLYKAGYAAVKGVDRTNRVLIGEFTSAANPLGFLRKVVAGQRLKADGLAYHPFQFSRKPGVPDRTGLIGISNTPLIKRTLAELAKKNQLTFTRGARRTIPIYYTEFGFQRKGGGIYGMPESRRAQWTVAAFKYAKAQKVVQLLYYHLVEVPRASLRGEIWDSSLVRLNGRVWPAYTALLRCGRRCR